MSAETTSAPAPDSPYAQVAARLVSNGWSPIPLRPGKKVWPPGGRTGREAMAVDHQDVTDWIARGVWYGQRYLAVGNVALAMPAGVVGIDVDTYDGKRGADTMRALTEKLGRLPRTIVSSRRFDTHPSSGIRFFRVPKGVELVGNLTDEVGETKDVEIVQRHHRYAVIAPSVVDGQTYRLKDQRTDEMLEVLPPADELPMLPDAWVQHLRVDPPRPPTAPGAAPVGLPGGLMSHAVQQRVDEATFAVRNGSRHDTVTAAVMALVRLGERGETGVTAALDQLRAAFVAAVTADGTRTMAAAQAEYDRMLPGAQLKVAQNPSPTAEEWTPTGDPTWPDTARTASLPTPLAPAIAMPPSSSTSSSASSGPATSSPPPSTPLPPGSSSELDRSPTASSPTSSTPSTPSSANPSVPTTSAPSASSSTSSPSDEDSWEQPASSSSTTGSSESSELPTPNPAPAPATSAATTRPTWDDDEDGWEVPSTPSAGEHEPPAHSEPAEPPAYVPSWQPLDVDLLLDDGYEGPKPTLWPVGGGHHWLYPGAVHTVFAQPGTFKSYLTLWAIAQEMNLGHRCLLVDAEEHASVAIHRLRTLGASPEQLRSQFAIVEPAANPHTEAEYAAFASLVAGSWDVVVIDSVTRTGALSGIKSNDQDSITHWFNSVPNAFARRGAAVIVVDHVPKPTKDAAEGSERYAGGSNAKLGIVQVALRLSPGEGEAPRRGIVSRIRGSFTKDRHGQITTEGTLYDIVIDSTDEARVKIEVHAVAAQAPATVEDKLSNARAAVIRALQFNAAGLPAAPLRAEARTKSAGLPLGGNSMIDDAVLSLQREGVVKREIVGRATVTSLTDEWMQRCKDAGIPVPDPDTRAPAVDPTWDPESDLNPEPQPESEGL